MFSRKFSGFVGLMGTLIVAGVSLLILFGLEMPFKVRWIGAAIVAAFVVIRIINLKRGAAVSDRKYSSFESNKISDPLVEEFAAPYDRKMAVTQDEAVLDKVAPLIQVMAGIGDLFSGGVSMGKRVVKDAENALIMTNRRLIFLMIGPELLRKYNSSPAVTEMMENLPGDASDKRRMFWRKGGQEIKTALDGLTAEKDLDYILNQVFSFSIPYEDLSGVAVSDSGRGITWHIGGKKLRHEFKGTEPVASITKQLADLGVMRS